MIGTSESSQSSYAYLPRFYRSPLKHFFTYYNAIFKLILFHYDTYLSYNFCGIIDQCGYRRLILKQPSFMMARVHQLHYYVFHGRVTLFFANNSLTQCRITMKFLHNFFLNHEVFFSSHTMFINTSTMEFTLVNSAIPSHGIAFEHFQYYKMVANVY